MALIIFSLFSLILLAISHLPIQVIALASGPDFTYMKVVQNAIESPPEKTYDYVIIGGGTAGCPLAATLSESHSVLVLERGQAAQSHPNALSLAGFFANLMHDDGVATPAQHFTSDDGIANARGRVLGGSSMINAGFYSRANGDFFGRSGVDWDAGSVEEAYRWVEETVVSQPEVTAWQTAVKEGLLANGVSPDHGFGLSHELGTKVSGSTFDKLGRRHGSVELLNKANFKNLQIAVEATVQRVIFNTEGSKPKAIGVEYTDSHGKSHRAFVSPKGEVILSAGALGSPQLLLLSGIGPKPYLSSQGIPVILANPNVGEFMADNPRNNINIILPYPVTPSSVQVVGITRDYYIEALSAPMPLSVSPFPFGFYPSQSSVNLDIATLGEKLSNPLSSGSLQLASPTDAKIAPRVRFNYFADPTDLSNCVAAMRKVDAVLNTGGMEKFKHANAEGEKKFVFFGEALPANKSDDSSMEAFCQSSVTTIWHYHGGCVVGKVVDCDYRVIGVDSLRVIDGSTLTLSPGTNPQATLMMMGRYVGLRMLRERGSHESPLWDREL